MSKKNLVIVIVVILLVVVGVIGFWQYGGKKGNNYSVVYLTTGEVYVGKLTTFPTLQLKDSYILQTVKDTVDPSKSNFQLNPINEALWASQSLHLNRENVVFHALILPTSKIAEALELKKK